MGEGGLWLFVSFRNFFSDNTRVRIFFFVAQSANFFVQNLTLGYMTKTLNQIFFFLHQNQNIFFQQHWESEYFFRKKTITPPLQVKWSFPNQVHPWAYMYTYPHHKLEHLFPILQKPNCNPVLRFVSIDNK